MRQILLKVKVDKGTINFTMVVLVVYNIFKTLL